MRVNFSMLTVEVSVVRSNELMSMVISVVWSFESLSSVMSGFGFTVPVASLGVVENVLSLI